MNDKVKEVTKFLRETASLGLVIATFGISTSRWPLVPDQIPIHFGLNGRPDGWGPKGMIFVLPAISLGLWALLCTLRRFPQRFNFPIQITSTNRERQERLAIGLLDWIRLETGLLFCLLTWDQSQIALKRSEALNLPYLAFVVALILGSILVYVWSARRLR